MKKNGKCFMCKEEGIEPPAEGTLANGKRIDPLDAEDGVRRVKEFRGFVCDMHAGSDDIVSIKYIKS